MEADTEFAVSLSDALAEASLTVEALQRGSDAVAVLATARPDLIIIDVNLADVPWARLCTELRGRSTAPLLVVNACGRRVTRKEIWAAGADAYVSDPVRLGEIRARARALIRRHKPNPTVQRRDVLSFGPARIDLASHTASINGRLAVVFPREFQLLEVLVRAQGHLVASESLHDLVWGPKEQRDLRNLNVQVSRLRRNLEAAGWPKAIVNVRTLGYKLVPPNVTAKSGPRPRDHDAFGLPQDAKQSITTPRNGGPVTATFSQPAHKLDRLGVLVIGTTRSSIEALVTSLRRKGFSVAAALDGTNELAVLEQFEPDLLLVDCAASQSPGFDLCNRLRSKSSAPIIMVLPNNSEIDIVVCLEIGADDCITKSCSSDELLARIRSLLRMPKLEPQAAASDDDTRLVARCVSDAGLPVGRGA